MGDATWAPGPYRVIDGQYGPQIHSDRFWLANIKCEACPIYEQGTAQLFAAAPDMAEALEECVATLEKLAAAVPTLANEPGLIKARAALAKAKGSETDG